MQKRQQRQHQQQQNIRKKNVEKWRRKKQQIEIKYHTQTHSLISIRSIIIMKSCSRRRRVLGRYNHPIKLLNFSKETKLDTGNCINPFAISMVYEYLDVWTLLVVDLYLRTTFVCVPCIFFRETLKHTHTHTHASSTYKYRCRHARARTHIHTHKPEMKETNTKSHTTEPYEKSISILTACSTHTHLLSSARTHTHSTRFTHQKFIVAPSFTEFILCLCVAVWARDV